MKLIYIISFTFCLVYSISTIPINDEYSDESYEDSTEYKEIEYDKINKLPVKAQQIFNELMDNLKKGFSENKISYSSSKIQIECSDDKLCQLVPYYNPTTEELKFELKYA